MKKIISAILACIMLAGFCSCSKGGSKAGSGSGSGGGAKADTGKSKECFEIEDNVICGLTDYGKTADELVIPENCEGFVSTAFDDAVCTKVSFESDRDIDIQLVFTGIETLKSIELPANISSLDPMAFQNCSALESITLPAGITKLPIGCFNGCGSLESVTFEGDVTSIAQSCFRDCISLKSITLPASVEEIGFEAFYNCTSLESIELPESLKTLDGSAFIYCSSLSSVTLSSSLKEVGMSCIRGTSVTDIYVPSDLEFTKWDNISFFNMDYPDPITVHVAEGSWADANFEEVFGDSVKTYN